jgi:hypothetical protein
MTAAKVAAIFRNEAVMTAHPVCARSIGGQSQERAEILRDEPSRWK